MNKINYVFSLFLVLGSTLTLDAQAKIFKCENSNGSTVYHDKPCAVTEKETTLKSVKDPVNGYVPEAFVADEAKNNKKGIVIGLNSKASKDNAVSPEKDEKSNIGTLSGNDTASSNEEASSSKKDEVSSNQSNNENEISSEEAYVMKLANSPENKVEVPSTTSPSLKSGETPMVMH